MEVEVLTRAAAYFACVRWAGDTRTGRLLGVQLLGRLGSEIAKRVDVAATAVHCGLSVDDISDLDLTYTPPLGSRGTRCRPAPRLGSEPGRDPHRLEG